MRPRGPRPLGLRSRAWSAFAPFALWRNMRRAPARRSAVKLQTSAYFASLEKKIGPLRGCWISDSTPKGSNMNSRGLSAFCAAHGQCQEEGSQPRRGCTFGNLLMYNPFRVDLLQNLDVRRLRQKRLPTAIHINPLRGSKTQVKAQGWPRGLRPTLCIGGGQPGTGSVWGLGSSRIFRAGILPLSAGDSPRKARATLGFVT